MPRKVPMIPTVLMVSVIYVVVAPAYFSTRKVVSALPVNSGSNNPSDVHNFTDGTQDSRAVSPNEMLKPGVKDKPPKNNLNSETDKVAGNASSTVPPNKMPCVSIPEQGTISENYECFYGIGVFMSMMSMLVISSVFQASVDLKHILFWNILLYYLSQVVFHLFFMFRDWNFHFEVECLVMMRDIATFSNFFLLTTISWSSIMSSDLCMVKSYAIWDVKKVNGSIRITNKVAFLQASALIAVLFSCISMGIIYSIHVMTYVNDCSRFCWVIQKNTSPLMFAVSVLLMAILSFVCFCKRIELNGMNDNYPEFEYYVFYVRKNNNVFFCLSILLFIMWGFNVLVSILDLSWLWTFFVIVFDCEGLLLFIIHQYCKPRDYMPDTEEQPNLREPTRPPRYKINTVATQTKVEC